MARIAFDGLIPNIQASWVKLGLDGGARLLDAGMHYAEISRTTGASTATITRIASWLNHGEGGYRAMLDKLAS